MFKINFKFFFLSIVLVNIFFMLGGFTAATGGNTVYAANSTQESSQYVAYYFYNSKRCSSCYRIENWSEAAIQENFQQELSAGKLKWRAINIEEPENEHFIQDFNLYSKSLVIVEQDKGSPERSKKLKKVWRLVRDKEKFFHYVSSEIRDFMEKD